ncbi:MAG: amidohydrolase family protein [Hespellia sp.]|nr:amidohydrolase family protein [Hespellia sp.]
MIDFHVHIFPERIAGRTLEALACVSHYVPFTTGTASGIMESAKEAGIETSVLLPVLTSPKQFESVHRFAMNFLDGPLLSFGGMHPECADYKEKLHQIKSWGFRGIKLHPDYQNTFFNDIRIQRILSFASELGLIVVTHAGMDPAYPDCIHCTPKMIADVLDNVAPQKLVLAHMGGFQDLPGLEEYVIGRDVYLDTAMSFGRMTDADFVRISRKHGIDKILFATDSPWSGQKESVAHLKQMDLTEEEQQKILQNNAKNLLTE